VEFLVVATATPGYCLNSPKSNHEVYGAGLDRAGA